MSGVNVIHIAGRLGGDPEVRYTPNGKAVCNLSVATSEKYQGEETTYWHRVVCWGKLAELAGEYLHKGDMAFFQGKMTYRKYQDNSGVEKQSAEIIAREMTFLGSPSRQQGQQQQRPQQQRQPAAAAAQEDFDDDIPF